MSQHDFTIANQTASSARSDINNALQALASLSSGTGAPSTTFANMLWYETDTNRLKMRNESDTAWLDIGYINQSDGLEILDNTKLVDTSGNQTGILGDQSTATWTSGTGTTDSLVSPADVKAAILALSPPYVPPTDNGAVGTYKFLIKSGSGAVSAGGSYSGSTLLDGGVNASQTLSTNNTVYNANTSALARGGAYQSGTWRAMGTVNYQSGSSYGRGTVFLRIS